MESPTQNVKTVAIVGAGIGGLSLALLLKESGFNVMVFDRDETADSRKQGYVIGINETGKNVLMKVLPKVPELSEFFSKSVTFGVVNLHLQELMEIGRGKDSKSALYAVHRWGLRSALAKGEPDVHWNKEFLRYEERDEKVIIFFRDETSVEADFLVGADGANSKVRMQRCPTLTREHTGVASIAGSFKLPENCEGFKTVRKFIEKGFLRIFGVEGHTVLVFLYKDTSGDDAIVWTISFPSQEIDKVLTKKETKELAEMKAKDYFTVSNREVEELINHTKEVDIFDLMNIYSASPLQENPFQETSRVILLGFFCEK